MENKKYRVAAALITATAAVDAVAAITTIAAAAAGMISVPAKDAGHIGKASATDIGKASMTQAGEDPVDSLSPVAALPRHRLP